MIDINLIQPAGDFINRNVCSIELAKKGKPRDEDAVAKAEAGLSALVKASREAANKAESIENAVYDLKAVNPHRKAVVDTRTPAELLDLIEEKGREVASALAVLRSLHASEGSPN